MLIKSDVLERIVAGEIDLVFRRWKRPTVKAGGRLRTSAGELAIEEVTTVSEASLTRKDAQRAGYRDIECLKADLASRPDGQLYRIELRYDGVDRRYLLRKDNELSDADCADIVKRLERIDRGSPIKALSLKVLHLISLWPERRAQDLATEVGMEKSDFKLHVRKLKELGLTESMKIGYRLSPRGQRLLDFVQKRGRI
ncbi:MAG: hypothetical protein ACFCUW_14965 [Kiloniellaceae bacterium]